MGLLGVETLFGQGLLAGAPVTQEFVNIAFVAVFLGIPLVVLLVVRACAARRDRVEDHVRRLVVGLEERVDDLQALD